MVVSTSGVWHRNGPRRRLFSQLPAGALGSVRCGGSEQPELADRVALLGQLGHRRVDPLPGEVVDLQPLQTTGKDEMRPSGTPYEPSDGMPIEVQLPSGVPLTQS